MSRISNRRLTRFAATLASCAYLTLLGSAPIAAQESCPCPPPAPPPPLWTGSAGLAYLATSGNTDTESLGFTASFARQPTPWGLEVTASANRSESNGATTAERYFGGVRGKRALDDRFELFGGLSYARDEFAGFDSRVIVEAGAIWKALGGPVHELALDAGLTWTDEEPVVGQGDAYVGAIAGAAYAWKINDAATFRERLVFFPNFETSEDWRVRSETSFEAAFAPSWALRLSYLYTRDNLPVPGFEKSDGTTAVSVVWKR